jgi:hypothetical protein
MVGTKVKGNPMMQIDKVRNIKISPFIILLIFYCLLDSAHTTVSFNLGFRADIVVAFICFIYFNSISAIKISSSTFFASVILLIGALFYQHGGKYYVYIGIIMQVSLAVVLINVKNQWRVELFDKISNWFAILISISLFAWLIHLFLPLPHTIIIEESAWNNPRPIYDYFFFREFDPNADGLSFARFQSVFLEPGHLGTIVAFFLFADHFDFLKKRNIVFLLAVIVSFSASAYVLVGIGYLLHRFSSKNFFQLVIAALLLGAFIWFFAGYNGGDNVVNNLIFGKLTREEGAIEGRVTLGVVQILYNMWSTGEDLLLGKGVFGNDDELLGSGIILFFVQQGIVGTILLFLVYYCIYKSCKSRYGFLFFLLYIISFLQRTYPYWDFFIITFILWLSYVKYDQTNDIVFRRHKIIQQ